MNPREIVFLDNIIQAYDGLGLVTTTDAAAGEVVIHVTEGTRDEVMKILRNFPRNIEILSFK
jgi:hydrogenase maturation factor